MIHNHTHKGTITSAPSRRAIRLGLLSLLACCLLYPTLGQNANKPQKVRREPNGQQMKAAIKKNEVNLTPAPLLAGQVTDSSGRPVTVATLIGRIYNPNDGAVLDNILPQFIVTVDNSGHYSVANIDQKFRYSVCLCANTSEVCLGSNSHCEQVRLAKISAGKTVTLNFTVPARRPQIGRSEQGSRQQEGATNKFAKRGLLRGQATWFGGSDLGFIGNGSYPAQGVRITINGITATTDKDGNYSMHLPPGTYKINLNKHYNYQHGWEFLGESLTVTIPRDGETVLNLQVQKRS